MQNVTPIFGEFKRKNKFCKLCKKYFIGYEEKQTDVNIAIELLRRAVNDEYDTAFIVSGDSDLLPAINATKKTFPDKTIKLIRPPGRGTESLKLAVHQYMKIREKHLTNNQLPSKITKDSLTIERPEDWN